MALCRLGLFAAAIVVAVGCRAGDGDGGDAGNAGNGATGGDGGAGGTSAGGGTTTGTGGGAGSGGATVDCDDLGAACTSEFGSLFTNSNARADGTVTAMVRPSQDTGCELYNNDHVVLQLSILGQVQRLVVAVDGVAVTTASAPLLGPAFAEGWHEDVHLDYVTDLGVHSDDFDSVSMQEAVDFICSHMSMDAPVSVHAYSDGSKPSSAHQIHRNDHYPDGAIVAAPDSGSPVYLLFRYESQVF